MRIAKQKDWKTKSLPLQKTTIFIERVFSKEEMKQIQERIKSVKVEEVVEEKERERKEEEEERSKEEIEWILR